MTMDSSYLQSQVATIVTSLHNLFDEIGVDAHDRDTREAALYAALQDTLHSQLRLVAAEKNSLIEEANKLVCTIKQMTRSLDDNARDSDSSNGGTGFEGEDLQVTYPLLKCVERLREKHGMIGKVHAERFEQVKKLVHALTTYSSQMEAGFVRITLPNLSSPSPTFKLTPSYVESLDEEFSRVYEEFTRRMATVQSLCSEIVQLWAELGTPSAQTDRTIVECCRNAGQHTGVRADDVARLRTKKEKLVDEKRARERKCADLKQQVQSLWDRLGMEESETKAFSATVRGCGLRVIQAWDDELARLMELKKQNLHIFVEDARQTLQDLWDNLYYSEDEMLCFAPAFSDVYTDALLEAHEIEIARLQNILEERAPILTLVEKHQTLLNDRNSLEASSQDASRLMSRGANRDPTRLLREEKLRKKIAKDLPKVERDLVQLLENWEHEYGKAFTVHGEVYLDIVSENQRTASSGRAASRTPAPRGAPSARATPAPKGPAPRSTPAPTNSRQPRAKTPTATNHNQRLQTKSPTPFGRTPLSGMSNTNADRKPAPSAGNKTPNKNGRTTPNPTSGGKPTTPGGSSIPRPKMPAYMMQAHTQAMKMGPPKMRALEDAQQSHGHQQHTAQYGVENQRPNSVLNNRVPFQDPYVDDEDTFNGYPTKSRHPNYGQIDEYERGSNDNGSVRIISNASANSIATGASSENWETYGEDSADEAAGALDDYYEKIRSLRGKRTNDQPQGAGRVASKKARGIRANTRDGYPMEHRVDEDGWSDEAF